MLGTCLSLDDLRAIARRARGTIDPGSSAYSLHSWFVDMVGYPNELSKLVDKAIEKRHGKAARAVRGAQNEREIDARWKEISSQGLIAGAYWGAMSHPLCSDELQWRLFGEIHMLSHLAGASRRSDLARVQQLEVACSVLDGKLAQFKHDHRALLKEHERLEDELTSRRREDERKDRRLAGAQRQLRDLESQALVPELRGRIGTLERLLGDARAQVQSTEAALSDSRRLIEALRAVEGSAAEEMRELSAENEALEKELTASVAGALVESQPEPREADAVTDLCGKRILCVGGRIALVQYYRALVERRGGLFSHHDGGLEDSMDAATRALRSVDVVVCPVDFVSHAACLKVKRACKHLAIPFVPLRSSGLSSFARGIRRIASGELGTDRQLGVEQAAE